MMDVADECLVIPVCAGIDGKKDMFTFSKAGAFLIRLLKVQRTEQELIDELVAEYNISRQKATKDVNEFLSQLTAFGIIEE